MTDDALYRVRQTAAAIEDVPPMQGDGDAGGPAGPPGPEPDELVREAARLPLNDTGNGRRFALYFGSSALVVPRVGWFAWDGRRWKLDQDQIAMRGLAQQVQDRIVAEIPHLVLEDWQLAELVAEPQLRGRQAALQAIPPADLTPEQAGEIEDVAQRLVWIRKIKDRKSQAKSDHRTFAKTSGNKGRIDAMLTEATVQLARDVDDLDSDPLCINTESGLLRFTVSGGAAEGYSRQAEVVLEPHAREAATEGGGVQYITKMMPVPYDPDAGCPLFDAFLARVQPDVRMRRFLQRWFGLSLTALTGEQKFAFLYGSGANGKSVLMDLLARMSGDYAASAKIESLTGRNRRGGGDATPDLVPLVNARLVRASEPEEGERLLEGTIKELTGGEKILVRQLHADFVEIQPRFKLTISGNHKPDIRGTDDGIWRRVLLVPFDVQIPPSERDEKLGDKLFAERAGILNWLVEGLLDYLESGLQEPDQVLDATRDYRADSDPIGTFLQDACCVSGDAADFLTARELMDGFNLWLDMRGEGMWGERTVSLKFKGLAGRWKDPATGRTYTPGKQKVTGYRGIRFQEMFRWEFDDAPRNAKGHPVAATARAGGGHMSASP